MLFGCIGVGVNVELDLTTKRRPNVPVQQETEILHSRPETLRLVSVSIHVGLLESLATVEIEQEFVNHTCDNMEVRYRFPLDSSAAVHKFSATLADRTVEGVVKETEAARRDYKEGVAAGDTGFLLERDALTADIFECFLGNVHRDESVRVSLGYVAHIPKHWGYLSVTGAQATDAAVDDSYQLRFSLPLGIYPRYCMRLPEGHDQGEGKSRRPGSGGHQATNVVQDVVVSILNPYNVQSVESPTHTLNICDEETKKIIHVQAQSSEGDLILLVRKCTSPTPTRRGNQNAIVYVESSEESDDALCMVMWSPRELQGDFICDSNIELLFLVDCSGSMRGSKEADARTTLAACLASLPENAYFNIFRFGSRFVSLFDSSMPLTDQTKPRATKYALDTLADMGGTEMMDMLSHIIVNGPLQAGITPRAIFLITDGEVSNTDSVVSVCGRDHRKSGTRYFTFGIGSGASKALVDGVANSGGGGSEFIAEGESIADKVMRQLSRALFPAMRNVQVDWGNAPVSMQSPSAEHIRSHPIFQHSDMTCVARIGPGAREWLCSGSAVVSVFGTDPDGRVVTSEVAQADFTRVPSNVLRSAATLAMLSELVKRHDDADDLTEKHDFKQQAIALSIANGVMCKWTAFSGRVFRKARQGSESKVEECEHAEMVLIQQAVISEQKEMSMSRRKICCASRAGAAPISFLASNRVASSVVPSAEPGGALHRSLTCGMSVQQKSIPQAKASPRNMKMDVDREHDQSRERDVATLLLGVQAASGAWSPSSELFVALGEPDVDGAGLLKRLGEIVVDPGAAVEVMLTVYVLAFLEIRHADSTMLWSLAAKKAKKWIARSQASAGSSQSVESLITACKSLLLQPA